MYCFLVKKTPNKISLKNNKQYEMFIVVTLVFFLLVVVICLLHYLPTLKGKIRKITKIKYKKNQETKIANYFEKQKQKEKKP